MLRPNMTRRRARDYIQNDRRIHRGLLSGLQFGKPLHIGVKALSDLFDCGFLVERTQHITGSCRLISDYTGLYILPYGRIYEQR